MASTRRSTRAVPPTSRGIRTVKGRAITLTEGGASFYFGFEPWQNDPKMPTSRTRATRSTGFSVRRRTVTSPPTRRSSTVTTCPVAPVAAWPRTPSVWPGTRRPTSPRCTSTTSWKRREPTAIRTRCATASACWSRTNGGTTWRPLATNNSILSTACNRMPSCRSISRSRPMPPIIRSSASRSCLTTRMAGGRRAWTCRSSSGTAISRFDSISARRAR